MKISNFLKENQLLIEVKASAKEDAIKKTAQTSKGNKELINLENFLKNIFEREVLGTIGVDNQIAISHVRSQAVKSFVIAFERSFKGIDFEALDNKPIKLIFLVGVPKEKELNFYLKELAHLIWLLQKKIFKENLSKVSTPKEVVDIFKKLRSKNFKNGKH